MFQKKVICFCKHQTGLRGIKALVELKANIKLIIVQEGFDSTKWRQELEIISEAHNIPVQEVKLLSKQKEIWEKIKNIDPDFAFTIMFTQLIPNEVIEYCKFKLVNFHPSLLPKYRGPHPVNWAIINGETKSGVTAHFVNEIIDGGPIIRQDSFEISERDTNITLQSKIDHIVEEQVRFCYNQLISGITKSTLQNEDDSSYFRMRTPEDGAINWKLMNAKNIYDLSRSLQAPLDSAFSHIDGEKFDFSNVKVMKGMYSNLPPGTIIEVEGSEIIISTITENIKVVNQNISRLVKSGLMFK